jgi:hypothetical protein
MDVEYLLDGVTNGTQATDVLSKAIASPDLAHIKAALLVAFFMLCRDLVKYVTPRVIARITKETLPVEFASLLSDSPVDPTRALKRD